MKTEFMDQKRSMTLPASPAPRKLDEDFSQLFAFLREAEYAWEPLIPERLQACRRQAEAHLDSFDALTQFFGLGMDVEDSALRSSGLPEELLPFLAAMRPAVSRVGALMVPHHHWFDACPGEDYVYLGRESLELSQLIQNEQSRLKDRNVLDLGSGSGALAFEIASVARRVLGLELSASAVEWANAAAKAQGIGNASFAQACVGEASSDHLVVSASSAWDVAVFNPPMAIPKGGARPFRDGGHLGMEVPLGFLAFAGRHLKLGGEVMCLITNPVMDGRSAFFDRLDRKLWRIEDRKLLNDRFNQSLYRKDGYADLRIDRVELWFLRLSRIG